MTPNTSPSRSAGQPSVTGGAEVSADRWLDTVIALLDRQRAALRELELLGAAQSEAVNVGASERLLEVLAHKQRVVQAAQQVDDQLRPLVADWDRRVAELPERARVLLRTRTDDIEGLVSACRARDEADCSALEAQQSSIAIELASASRAGGAARAYASSAVPPAGPLFQDRQG